VPRKKEKAPHKSHDHRWYAISYDGSSGKPVLFACGVHWWCIATTRGTLKGRGGARKLHLPEDIIPTPTHGLWHATEKHKLKLEEA